MFVCQFCCSESRVMSDEAVLLEALVQRFEAVYRKPSRARSRLSCRPPPEKESPCRQESAHWTSSVLTHMFCRV